MPTQRREIRDVSLGRADQLIVVPFVPRSPRAASHRQRVLATRRSRSREADVQLRHWATRRDDHRPRARARGEERVEDEPRGACVAQQARLQSHHRIQQRREDRRGDWCEGKTLTEEEEIYLEELYVPKAIQGHG